MEPGQHLLDVLLPLHHLGDHRRIAGEPGRLAGVETGTGPEPDHRTEEGAGGGPRLAEEKKQARCQR